ncbi:MAG: hypothetical protein ACN6NS_08225 [Acinetobacter johnsonii]
MFEIDIGLAGTLLGALIGALALLVTVRKTAEKVHDNFRADKLAEAKRDAYLNFIRKWQNILMVSSYYLNLKKSEFNEIHSKAWAELIGSLHEASFISNPSTKEKIMEFTFKISEDLFQIKDFHNQWYLLSESEIALKPSEIILGIMEILDTQGLQALELQKFLRNEIGLIEDDEVEQRIMKLQKKLAEKVKRMIAMYF